MIHPGLLALYERSLHVPHLRAELWHFDLRWGEVEAGRAGLFALALSLYSLLLCLLLAASSIE